MRKLITFLVIGTAAVAALGDMPLYSNYGGTADPAAIGLSTGALTDSGVAAPAGTNWSECQHPTGDLTQANTSAGFSARRAWPQPATPVFNLADDFTVPGGQQWQINAAKFYAYRTGNDTVTTPFARAYVQIWNGRPGDEGASVIYGDLVTDRLASSAFAGMYRIFNTVAPAPGSAPGTTRPIWENTVNVGTTLGPGTYWVEWTYELTSTAYTSFSPTITVPGTRFLAGWNARQYVNDGVNPPAWADVIDTGNPATAPDYAQDMPFILIGVPEPASLALLALAGLLIRRR